MDWEPTHHLDGPEGKHPHAPMDEKLPGPCASREERVLPTRGCLACAEWACFTGDMYRAFTLMQRNGAFLEGIYRSGNTEVWRNKAVREALRYYGVHDGLLANPLARSFPPRGGAAAAAAAAAAAWGGDSPGVATDNSTSSGEGYSRRSSDGGWGERRGHLTAAEKMWRY